MGQSPSQLAQSYPYEYGCDVRLKGSLLTEDDAVELYWILRFAQNDKPLSVTIFCVRPNISPPIFYIILSNILYRDRHPDGLTLNK